MAKELEGGRADCKAKPEIGRLLVNLMYLSKGIFLNLNSETQIWVTMT